VGTDTHSEEAITDAGWDFAEEPKMDELMDAGCNQKW
jgi:hypothetical protein